MQHHGEKVMNLRREWLDTEEQRRIVVCIEEDCDEGNRNVDETWSQKQISEASTRGLYECEVKNLVAATAQDVQEELARKFNNVTFHPSQNKHLALGRDFGKTVPVVCVCVQGGPATVDTVLQVNWARLGQISLWKGFSFDAYFVSDMKAVSRLPA